MKKTDGKFRQKAALGVFPPFRRAFRAPFRENTFVFPAFSPAGPRARNPLSAIQGLAAA